MLLVLLSGPILADEMAQQPLCQKGQLQSKEFMWDPAELRAQRL